MAKRKQEPDVNRRQTRPKNANAHPGLAAMEVLAVRRSREEIEHDKKARDDRRQARKKKKDDEHAAAIQVAEFENQMAVDDREQEATFPRRRQAENTSRSRRKKGQTSVISESDKMSLTAEHHKADTDTDVSDSEQHELKKRKTSDLESTGWRQQPLRRTETFIYEEIQIDDRTPKAKPKQKKNEDLEINSDDLQSGVESEDEDYETPKALKRVARQPKQPLVIYSDDDSNFQVVDHVVYAEDNFIERETSIDQESDPQTAKTIDLAKEHKARKDNKAFRKEVKEKRDLVAKREVNHGKVALSHLPTSRTGSQSIAKPARSSGSSVTTSGYDRSKAGNLNHFITFFPDQYLQHQNEHGFDFGQSTHTAKKTESKLNSVAMETIQVEQAKISATNKIPQTIHPKPAQSRTSATSGNGIGISQPTRNLKSKPNSAVEELTVEEPAVDLSDEDNEVERAAVLQSPIKGIKRLSSEAIVKIEKPLSASNEARKSRAKKYILSSDVLAGWSKSVMSLAHH